MISFCPKSFFSVLPTWWISLFIHGFQLPVGFLFVHMLGLNRWSIVVCCFSQSTQPSSSVGGASRYNFHRSSLFSLVLFWKRNTASQLDGNGQSCSILSAGFWRIDSQGDRSLLLNSIPFFLFSVDEIRKRFYTFFTFSRLGVFVMTTESGQLCYPLLSTVYII